MYIRKFHRLFDGWTDENRKYLDILCKHCYYNWMTFGIWAAVDCVATMRIHKLHRFFVIAGFYLFSFIFFRNTLIESINSNSINKIQSMNSLFCSNLFMKRWSQWKCVLIITQFSNLKFKFVTMEYFYVLFDVCILLK